MREVQQNLKIHLKLASLPEELMELVTEADKKWSREKPISQTLIRKCLWLQKDNMKKVLVTLRDEGPAKYQKGV